MITIIKHQDVQIRCTNMRFTNNTLIRVPNYKGKKISFTILGRQIANEVKNSKKFKKLIINRIKSIYNREYEFLLNAD